MTQNSKYNYNRRRSRGVKVMATILAIAVGGSVIATAVALIIAGI